MSNDDLRAIDRREFLRRGVATGVGATLVPFAASGVEEVEKESAAPKVRKRVTLGRTGLEVPDIGFGASRLSGEESLVRHALDRGVTYFDTAESYTGGDSETTLGKALKGERENVLIASKTTCKAGTTREALSKSLEDSLRRLQTDRIDVYFNHAVNDSSRLQNEAWGEFVTRAREQGKIRFTGMSGHGGQLAECLDYAFDHDLVDVVLVGFNYGQDPEFYERFTAAFDFVAVQPELPRLLAKAKLNNVGVVAMKTLRGGRLNDLRAYESGGSTFAQAAFRWVLSHPNVDSLVVTMRSNEMIDEYLGGSGGAPVSRADGALLARYERRNGASQCRYGCSDCASACPDEVAIDAVLRTRMYAEDYGDLELAREDYARLGVAASPCAGCEHQSCLSACPHGLDVPALTGRTHRLLGDSSVG